MRRSGPRLGCLTLLLIYSLFGACAQFFGDWGRRSAPEYGEGGRFALMGLIGAVLYITIFGTLAVFRWLMSLGRRERRGFPVIQPGNDEQ